MITKEMLRDGFNAGIVKLIDFPHWDGVACEIGDYRFGLGGSVGLGIHKVFIDKTALV